MPELMGRTLACLTVVLIAITITVLWARPGTRYEIFEVR